ncbi:hypothetical protein [Convivina intestini]|uniref:Uncharacterized protein n=1 Tax=Convivina intestini TaxID=1505726 RepID=A0A2U1DEQ1_9LACO|nr:hypothetical protein [Convivina intestini]PVY86166.1 hypothetical protein C7384_10179 [Convivina intestini]CAH1851405.1 hypothetical protein R077811_00332 [Convivina intestini]CAH1852902.1 hypothetical protein R078131_00569 [Convivina intestini]SDB81194.1 hypothetical protein SAMN05216341_10171 [Leuconostocaceae bacterium R-53105]
MNLPVSSTADTLRHFILDIQSKFAGSLNHFRDNILNTRDARVAAKRGEAFVPKHYPLQLDKNKRVYVRNDRYAYSPKNKSVK